MLKEITWNTGRKFVDSEDGYTQLTQMQENWFFNRFSITNQGIRRVIREPDNCVPTYVVGVEHGYSWGWAWPVDKESGHPEETARWCIMTGTPCKEVYVLKLRDENNERVYVKASSYYQGGLLDHGCARIFKTQAEVFEVIARIMEEEKTDPTPELSLEMLPVLLTEHEYTYQRQLPRSLIKARGLK